MPCSIVSNTIESINHKLLKILQLQKLFIKKSIKKNDED